MTRKQIGGIASALAAGLAVALALVGFWTVGGEESVHAQGLVNFDIDPDTTGNTASSLGTVEDCVEIVVGSPAFDDTSDYNIDIVVTGDTQAPLAYDAALVYDSSKVHIAAPGTDDDIKMPGAFPLSEGLPGTDGAHSFGAVYLSGGPGTAGDGTIVRVGLDIGASGLITFSLNDDPFTAYASDVTFPGNHPITVDSALLAINTSCPAYADVEIVSQQVRASDCTSAPPASIDVDTDTILCLRKSIVNNGPETPVDVSIDTTLTPPADCSVTPDPGNPTSYSGLTGAGATVDELFTINCTEPSSHSLSLHNEIAITSAGATDPDETNNSATTPYSINVFVDADISITQQVLADDCSATAPTELSQGTDVDVCVQKTIHSDGSYSGDVDVSIINTATPPGTCAATPDPSNPTTATVNTSSDTLVDEMWTLNCADTADDIDFSFSNTIAVTTTHVDDPDDTNDSDSAVLTVDVTPPPSPTPTPEPGPPPFPVYATTDVSDTDCLANADIESTFGILDDPWPSAMYDNQASFTPAEWGVPEAADIPLGAVVGTMHVNETLGWFNNPCAVGYGGSISFPFDPLMNCSIDTADTIAFDDQFMDTDGNGIQDGCDKYPEHLATMFPGMTPRARIGGFEFIGINVSLNLVIFEPGTSIPLPGMPPFGPELGYVAMSVLNDPTAPLVKNQITDSCPPVHTETVYYGLTLDNPMTAGVDESGYPWRTNPAFGGTYTFNGYTDSIRDADGDDIDNDMDTCPHIVNEGDPRVSYSGDDDGDGLDNVCDPTPDAGDKDPDGDGFPNRQDNCPLVDNEDQTDTDYDRIGDACDQDDWNDDGDTDDPGEPTGFNPNVPDGDRAVVWFETDIEISGPSCEEPGPSPPCTFNPVADVSLSDHDTNASADITTSFDIPVGDYNYDRHIHFAPAESGRGVAIPIGAHVADLDTVSTLGLLNNVCITALPVSFQMLNASVDTSDTVSFADSLVDMDGNTLPDGVDKYPDFLNTLFPGLTPSMRMFGVTSVAGTPVSMNMVEFEPGTALYGIAFDPALGRSSVQVLNDPTVAPEPGSITDFCTPLSTASTTFGVSKDNPATAADESGYVVSTNPATAGHYPFTTYTTNLGDADRDCIENDLDTCPFDINEGDPRVAGDGDPDNDGMDNACDPEPDVADTDYDNDVYLNRGDNCPLVANLDNADTDGDRIGDACDPNPNTPDGEAWVAWLETDIEIIDTGPGPPWPVTLVHVEPSGVDYTGNPYCPDTMWLDGKPTVNPWHDCNNITSQNHVIRTDGWDPAHHWLWSWNVQNFSGANATILAQGDCGVIAEVVTRSNWDTANDDEQCLVIHSSTPGETRVTLTYEEDGVVIITPPVIKEWDSLVDSVILKYGDLEKVKVYYDADGDTVVETSEYKYMYLPKDVNDDGRRDADDEHELDRQSTWQDHEVVWDEALKRVKVPVPVDIIEIVHGEHEVLVNNHYITTHQPTEGALILAELESERNCTYFTDSTGSANYGATIQDVSDNLGRVVVYLDTICEEQVIIHFYAQYPNLPGSLREGLHEWIGINWTTIELAKQPQIRWAGEEIILAKRWALPDDWYPNPGKPVCPLATIYDVDADGDIDIDDADLMERIVDGTVIDYQVRYVRKDPSPGALEGAYADNDGDGHLDSLNPPVSGIAVGDIDRLCISKALYGSEEPGHVDVEAQIIKQICPIGGGPCTEVLFNKHAFLIWYLKVYQVKLTNVDGARADHNAGNWTFGDGEDSEADTLNVSADTLLRVKAKGWFFASYKSSRGAVCIDMDGDGDEAGSEPGVPYQLPMYETGCPDPDDEIVDHGHWVLPDDLPALAGPDAINTRPNWDVMSEPDAAKTAAIGPKSTLDSHDTVLRPYVPGIRKTVVPDGAITEADAIMPPLKIRASIADSDAGFLKEVLKGVVYGGTNDYHSVMIPSDPEIPAFVSGGGYAWDSWQLGPYEFWTITGQTGAPFPYYIEFYTDNRGEGMFFANGDHDLSFDDCRTDPVSGAPDCSPGDVVGESNITVIGDYPYFRKHSAVLSNPVVKTWEWGGFKTVTAERLDANHTAIIAHLKDRDGYCKYKVGSDPTASKGVTFSPSLNAVQGEEIEFILNTDIGSIIDVSPNGLYNAPRTPLGEARVIGLEDGVIINRSEAVALAEDERVLDYYDEARAVVEEDECQAWIVIEHPLGEDPDVSVRFDDPEGVILRHWPAPTPTDYGVLALQTRGPGFRNPRPGGTETKVHVVVIRNFGPAAGPAEVSLSVSAVNPTCPDPSVTPLDPTTVTLQPARRDRIRFAVTYGSCGDPAPAVDYWLTGAVMAPGDPNPGNDPMTASQNAR